MKKGKLLLSLAMMCLSVAVLCFGVLAATNVKYGINGTISYTVSDAYVDITTKVYTSNAQTDSADTLKTYANKFVNEIPTTLGTGLTVTHQTSYDGKFDFNSLTGTLGTNDTYSSTDKIKMAFGSGTTDMYSMYIVVTIKNLADSTVYAHMSSFTNDITNVVGACTDSDLRVFKIDTSGITIVVAYSLANKTQSVETSDFSFSLQIRANEQFSYGQLTDERGGFFEDYEKTNGVAKYSSKLKNITFTNNSADFDMTQITTDDNNCVVGTAYNVNNNQTNIKAYFIPNGDLFDCYVYAPVNFMYIPNVSEGYFSRWFGINSNETMIIHDKVETIDLSVTSIDTSKDCNLLGFFGCCSSLKSIKGLENWDTSNVSNYWGMFLGCESLEELDLSNFTFKSGLKANNVVAMLGVNDQYVTALTNSDNYASQKTGEAKITVLASIVSSMTNWGTASSAYMAEKLYKTNIKKIICPKDLSGLNIATPCCGTIPDTAYKIDGTSDTTYFLQAGKTLIRNS